MKPLPAAVFLFVIAVPAAGKDIGTLNPRPLPPLLRFRGIGKTLCARAA